MIKEQTGTAVALEMMMQRDTPRDYTLTEHAQSDNVFVQC